MSRLTKHQKKEEKTEKRAKEAIVKYRHSFYQQFAFLSLFLIFLLSGEMKLESRI